jgi:hypothetical protein
MRIGGWSNKNPVMDDTVVKLSAAEQLAEEIIIEKQQVSPLVTSSALCFLFVVCIACSHAAGPGGGF